MSYRNIFPLLFFIVATATAQSPQKLTLPNGWSLSPAGRSLPLGDLPLNMVVSSSQKYLAVTNNGQGRQSLQLINIKKEKVLDDITIGRSWLGLRFSSDGKYLLMHKFFCKLTSFK